MPLSLLLSFLATLHPCNSCRRSSADISWLSSVADSSHLGPAPPLVTSRSNSGGSRTSAVAGAATTAAAASAELLLRRCAVVTSLENRCCCCRLRRPMLYAAAAVRSSIAAAVLPTMAPAICPADGVRFGGDGPSRGGGRGVAVTLVLAECKRTTWRRGKCIIVSQTLDYGI